MCWAAYAVAAADPAGVPLVVGNRTLHVFRAPLGAFSPAERAEGARQRIERSFEEAREGWTSVRSTPEGALIELDGKPMFYVLEGDASPLAGEAAEKLAQNASRLLQKAWSEAQERRDPQRNLASFSRVLVAALGLAAALAAILAGTRWLRNRLTGWLSARMAALPPTHFGFRMSDTLSQATGRLLTLGGWLAVLFALFLFLTYGLGQFALTRPAGENLALSLTGLISQGFHAVAEAIPGLFVSALIFLVAWVASRVSAQFFAYVATLPSGNGLLNAHTAPATSRIFSAALWLFAIAMAYPYLPGSHTEAFKGLSVIVGLMISLGSSGLVAQTVSGVMLAYTHALRVGEYVRILDNEGTVTELGLFVTRLRTGMGEEIALPNALVLTNVTRNFSRATPGRGFIFDTTVTIGYDTPWRQVHALLLEATASIPEILAAPAPYVVQTALSDFYVAYKLVVYIDSDRPATRAQVASALHAAIQDAFNRHGVQIMSPHYFADPEKPKIVPASSWSPPAPGS
jgi:small-conductance mechanosensitive channel